MLFFVTRNKPYNQRNIEKPIIRLEISSDTLYFNEKAVEILQLKEGDGVVFGFDNNKPIAVIQKQDGDNSFLLRRRYKSQLRFGSKIISDHFKSIFRLDSNINSHYFIIGKPSHDYPHFSITYSYSRIN